MASINVKVGGTWRSARPWVKVSGTWQGVKSGWVKVSGVWQQFYSYSLLTATMTESSWDDGVNEEIGYNVGRPFGSLSPSTMDTGYLVRALYDFGPVGSVNQSNILIGGFGADPGATGVFSTVDVNGTTKTAASATYLWIGAFGYASWTWGSTFGLDGLGTSPVIIMPP